MSWNLILKIKNNEGNNLIVSDVELFKERLRLAMNVAGAKHFGKIKRYANEGDPRKASVVIKESYVGELLNLTASVRHPDIPTLRNYYEFLMKEDDTGDYYYLSAFGPSLKLTQSSVVANENALLSEFQKAIEATIRQTVRESKDLRDTSEEQRQTGQEVIDDVESANPGYVMINQKMYNKKKLEEKAEKQGITYGELVRRMGG